MSDIIRDLIGAVIYNFFAIVFIAILLKQKVDWKKLNTIIAFIFMTTSATLAEYLFVGNLKSILAAVIHAITFKKIFNLTTGRSVFLVFIYLLCILVPDIIVTVFIVNILKVDFVVYVETFAGSSITSFVVGIMAIFILLILRTPLRKLSQIKIDFNKKMVVYIFLIMISILIFFWNVFSNYDNSSNLFVNLFLIIIFVSILLSLLKQTITNRNLELEYDNLIKYVKTYEEVIEKQREIQHENRNQLLTIKSKIFDKEKEEEIIKYIDSLYEEKTHFDKAKYSRLKYLPANGFKGLLYFKIDEAECQKINITLLISKTVENSSLYSLNTENYKQLCRIIGIYLDNAIEASCSSEKKILGIEIYKDEKGVHIVISNSYNNEIDLSKISNSRFSTKGKNRGYGLLFVKNIIGGSKIFEEEKEITNDLYIQKLIIKEHVTN